MFILSALRVNFFHSPDDQLPQTPRSTIFVDTSFKGKEKHCPNKRMILKWKGKTDILPGKWTWITDFINCSGWLIIRWHWVPSTSYPTMVANSQYGRQSSVNICPYILRIVSWVGTPLVIPYRNIAVNKGTSLHTHLIGNDMAFMLVYKNQFKDLYLIWSNICPQFYQPVKIVSF